MLHYFATLFIHPENLFLRPVEFFELCMQNSTDAKLIRSLDVVGELLEESLFCSLLRLCLTTIPVDQLLPLLPVFRHKVQRREEDHSQRQSYF